MPTPHRVLLTGAAGGVGTFLRESLPGYGYSLRLSDIAPVPGAPEALAVDLQDRDAVREAVRGVDAVVHLGGLSLSLGQHVQPAAGGQLAPGVALERLAVWRQSPAQPVGNCLFIDVARLLVDVAHEGHRRLPGRPREWAMRLRWISDVPP